MNWERMKNSPATRGLSLLMQGTVGVVKGGISVIFEPAFWHKSRYPENNSVIDVQYGRTIFLVVAAILSNPFENGEFLPRTLENWGVFAVACGFLAGAAIDWVGLGLQAIGEKKEE